ncbi:MAG: hypothetical protein IPH26_05415 [Sterolibacteriaceae bacterium]|uniref:Ubiquinone biosynthesis accessory factor UbiJ n=1 Tax=Candidatus Methylophosphatis roskildensis TaxID=2899263 RepID=A0A9D7DX29_9PROT|nr:hypothetical protein [Candidatus Methylophosphatis roskildensis]MBK7235118.1 hypothetical protein [Sterolibacteriaceae bacterium]
MLTQVAIASLNHVLGQAAWAREKLRPHAGRVALLSSPPLALRLSIEPDGHFAEAAADSPADAEIALPTGAVSRALQGFDAVSRHVSVSGNAEFAETLGFVLRNLRWDAEEDLSKVFGDIVARRMAMGFAQFASWQRNAARNFAETTADYLAEERQVLLRPGLVAEFASDVDTLRDDLARLEKRLEKLEAN